MAGKLHRLNREFEQMYLPNGEKREKAVALFTYSKILLNIIPVFNTGDVINRLYLLFR